jgi:putative membrane protein
MSVSDIPGLNATLNGIATLLIVTGFALIKSGRKDAHRKIMLTAGLVSALFLASYVTHKVLVRGVHTPFGGTGGIRTLYQFILWTHIPLAALIAYLVPRTFLFAIRGNFERHRAWAKWTFPIWLYVSVTGVLVYLFLYRWWPATAGS